MTKYTLNLWRSALYTLRNFAENGKLSPGSFSKVRMHVSNGRGDFGGGADADGAVYRGVFGGERD